MENKPTILSLTQHGKTVTISCQTSDVDIYDMADMIKAMLYATGYTTETIETIFIKD